MIAHPCRSSRSAAIRRTAIVVAASLAAVASPRPSPAQLCVQLNGATYRQNFNALPSSGSSNNSSAIPIGFAFSEAGGNITFAADTGASSTANTYSYGSGLDRALGEITSATLQSTIGACFVNNTGFAISRFSIGYTGEQWRLGAADTTDDRLNFQFSTNAASLTTGTWTDVNTLDFVSPADTGVGAKDGNAAANRHVFAPTAIIPASPVLDGATFFIRWVPLNITGANDGLAIDDFSLTHTPSADFDLDSDVDGEDFLKQQRGMGQSPASISLGDANRDNVVDSQDLFLWRNLYAGPPFAAAAAGAAVPEPTAACLAIVACAATSYAPRTRRQSVRADHLLPRLYLGDFTVTPRSLSARQSGASPPPKASGAA